MKRHEIKPRLGLRIPLAILIAIYMLAAPPYMRRLEENVYRSWLTPDDEPFSGVITVWHIVRFRPYSGSVGTWLDGAGAKIEKAHFGVYFAVLAMTEDEAAGRFAAGGRADVYSYPAGAEVPAVCGRAVEYMRSGYVLVVNAEYAARRGLEEPEDGLVTREWLAAAVERMSFTSGRRAVAALAGSGEAAAACGFGSDIPDVSAYKSGAAAMAIVDVRTYADIMRAHERGALFESWAYPFTGYTDLIQYVAAAADAGADKLPYIAEFCGELMSPGRQTALAALGMIPAPEPGEAVYPDVIVAGVADLVTGVVFDLVTLP